MPKQADVSRMVRAVIKAGVPVARVEVTADGRIVIIAADPVQQTAPADFRL
jgi:hypothetical protein